mmetsp:Transcript_24800/g.67562  ORF Transcript_24800/g.67562 Transcript_24800/m.67562 type:complete len:1116 (-) Transcript_24800:1623-4970(-)
MGRPAPEEGVGLMAYAHTKLWACQELVAATFLLYSKQDFVKHYLPVFIAFALLIMAAATMKYARLLKATVFARSLLRIAMMLQLSVRGETLNLLRYGDLPTYLMTFLPEMLVLDWNFGAPFFMFAFSHAGVCALFYYMTNIHSIPMSLCRGFGIHAVCICVFLAIRYSTNSYCMRASQGLVNLPPKAIAQLQKDAQDMQQELHQKHQYEQQQQEQKPAKAQQQEQHEEAARRHRHKQHCDDAAAGAPYPSLSKLQGLAGMCAASGPATPAAKSCDSGPSGVPQPQNLGLNYRMQLAPAKQEQATRQGEGAPWNGSDISAGSTSKSRISSGSISSISSSKPTQQHLRSIAPASPLVPRASVDSLKARTEMPRQTAYISKRSQPRSSGSGTTRHSRHTACRVAVKVAGHCHPDNLPAGAIQSLQDHLGRSRRLMPAESPAVRAGCLVVSYGVVPCSQDCTLQQMRDELVAVAKEWTHKHGLLSSGEEGLLNVQACCQSSWGSISTNLGLDCPPEHAILVPQPFLETIPSGLEQEVFCAFNLTLIAPPHFELRGWHGAADAPEDLPDDVKSRSLCLLASLDGQFLGTSVEQRSNNSNGEVSVQVRVSLPETMRDAATLHLKMLVLELWAVGTLVCSYAALLLPSLHAGALAELQGWADQAERSQEERSTFVRDLVDWMHFHTTCSNALVEGQQGMADMCIEGSAEQADEEVQDMLEVGMDLLAHCLGQGMSTLAGVLLNALASPPFSIPPSNLPDTLTPAAEQLADAPVCQQHNRQQHSPFPDPGLDSSPAEQPEAVQQPQDACKKGCPPSSSALVHQSLLPHYPADVLSSNPTTWSHPGTPAAGGGSSCPTPSAPPSSAPAPAPPAASTAACNRQASKSAVASVSLETAREEEFLAWKDLQIAPMASYWCKIKVLFFVAGVLRRWFASKGLEGKAAVIAELASFTPLVTTYAVGALFIGKAGFCTELILAAIFAARACFCVLVGLGVVPIPAMLLPIMNLRVEVLVEVLMMSVVEQVRMAWMFPLRLMLTIGFGLLYSHLGMVAPWCQAALLNACCLAVAKVMDLRYRRLHTLALSNARAGKPERADLQHDDVLGCGLEKVLPAKAGPSTVPKCKLA